MRLFSWAMRKYGMDELRYMYSSIHEKHPPPPADSRGGRKANHERRKWPESGRVETRHHCTWLPTIRTMWSQLECMRQDEKRVGCINFSIHGRARAWTYTKVKLAWLPPRHRNITIPFNCLWFGNYCIRLTYTASVHVQLPQRIGCWCQTLLKQLEVFSS